MSAPSSDKAAILARIREALSVPAHSPLPPDLPVGPDEFRRSLPPVPADYEGQVAEFARNASLLTAEFIRFSSLTEAQGHLRNMVTREKWERLAVHPGAMSADFAREASLPIPLMLTGENYDKWELEICSASLTGCSYLIARTGSIMITTASAGGRALSVLAPHHVVLAQKSQLLPDLAAAYQAVAANGGPPAFLSVITGPSRTADIERIIVLGAHGPRKLTVLFVG
jgi:L-lactate dehydrogenase complex protein LldG